MAKRDYDSTVARIAGNVASGLATKYYTSLAFDMWYRCLATDSVRIARAIMEEVRRTEPAEENVDFLGRPVDWGDKREKV